MDWKEIGSSPKLRRTEYFQGAQRGAIRATLYWDLLPHPRARIN